jgi:hypothetical protein
VLVEGKWNKLLDRPLEKLKWPGPESNSTITLDSELESLSIVASGSGVLSAGETKKNSFHLRATIDQAAWNGGVSVFWGLHPVANGYECDHIYIVRKNGNLGKVTHRLEYGTVVFDNDFDRVNGIGRSGVDIAFPRSKKELLIVIKNGELEKVTWAGDELSELLDDLRPEVGTSGGAGSFGLALRNCSATISNYRVFVE